MNGISVLIPAHNAERFIAEALESVAAQTTAPTEVIVVDDGSTDATAEIVAQWSAVRLILQANAGVAVARNVALAEATHDLIAFLDADDRWHPEKLTRQLQWLEEHPAADAVGCHVRHFGELQTGSMQRRGNLLEHDIPGFLLQALLIRRRLFTAIGGFDPTLRAAEDVDWLARARDHGTTIGLLADVLLERRLHDANTSLTSSSELLLRVLRDSIRRKRSDED